MSPWHTWPQREREPTAGTGRRATSPTLLYHKWHAYDLKKDGRKAPRDQRMVDGMTPTFDTSASRLAFLRKVASCAETIFRARAAEGTLSYRWWLENRYLPALEALGAHLARATTHGRLMVGFATNPALETGLTLHHLYGFPYIPGSAVRGLLHHVAEMKLVSQSEDWLPAGNHPAPLPRREELERALREAARIWQLFGSITVRQAKGPERSPGLPTLRTLLAAWWSHEDLEDLRPLLHLLLHGHTGGRLVLYDAVPALDQGPLLEPDLLNPHYPEYYDHEGEVPPSDDQNPRPIAFLSVASDRTFLFPYRVKPSRAVKDLPEAMRPYAEQEEVPAVEKRLQRWLSRGLADSGAGAKTAAGYGYLLSGESESQQ